MNSFEFKFAVLERDQKQSPPIWIEEEALVTPSDIEIVVGL